MSDKSHQQRQQNPQAIPAGVVREANEEVVLSATETVQQKPQPNGARNQHQYVQPQVMTAAAASKFDGRKHVIDINTDIGEREFFAVLADRNDMQLQASWIRGQKLDAGLLASLGRGMDHRITVKDIAYVVVGVGILILVWEGVAFKWDLPRMGLFDPANPLKAVKKA